MSQVIKSARVMKKAVGHLVPFMEEERERQFKEMTDQGETFDENVKITLIMYVFLIK